MANTSNYNWETPDDTDLVKDGAAAIRSLGTAIDTTVFNNAGAAIAKTIVDAKGDIIAATASDTVARLAVGANDTVLTADSSTATGLKWAAPAAGGGMTLLSTTTLSGATTTISSISGSYTNLYVVLSDVAASGTFGLRFYTNSSSGNSYGRVVQVPNSSGTVSTLNSATMGGTNNFSLTANTDNAAADVFDGTIEIAHYASTSGKRKKINSNFLSFQNGYYTANLGSFVYYSSTTAINSLTFEINTGTFSGGTVLVYGVK
jgi:hypothetical protein